MDTFTDITQTGALSYRDLLKQNNGSSLSNQEAELLKAFSGWATATPSKYDVSNLRSREIDDPIYKASGGKDYWGSSIWDDDVANAETLEHLLNIRANNQWGAVQILNGIGKGATTAVTTALDGTLGTLYGLGTGIYNVATGAKNADGSDKGFMQGLWDNDFNRAMAAALEEAEELMPNYYTDYEKEAPWYNNIFSANFLGDKVIKNAGFTIGALAATTLTGGAGGVAGKTVLVLAKGLAKQALKRGSVSAAKNMLRAGREFGQIANYAVNTGLSAHGEAAIEAINGTNEAFKTLDANVESRRQELLSQLNPQDPNYKAQVLQINNAVLEYKNQLSGLLTLAGNNIYLSNLAILSLTNSLEFGDLIKGGFGQTAKLAERTYTVEGKKATLREWAKALLEGKNAQVVNGVNGGAGTIALHTAKNFASEGFEEGAQNIASNTNQYYAMAELNRRVEDKKSPLHALSLARAEINPEASSKLADYGKAFAKTLEEQFGSIDAPGWEEVFLGGLTGALGFYNPMHRETTKDKNGDVVRDNFGNVIKKWKPLSFNAIEGGFLGAHREVTEANEENEKLVKLVNDATSKPEFIQRVKHAVASLDFEQAMTDALANEDKLAFKNAEIGKIISDALYFRDKGAIDEYKAIFEELTNIDDKTLGQIYLAANSKELEKEETEKVREQYQKKAKSTLEKINKTLEYYDYVEEAHRTMPEDWKREMANYYIRWGNTRDRIKELEDKLNKPSLKEIHNIKELAFLSEDTLIYSDLFTNDKDGDDYFRLKKLEILLNKTIKEYEKDPNKLWLEIRGAYLLQAAKELSLDSKALIEKLQNVTSPQEVDEILLLTDESIRESVFNEAFRNADSKTRGYIYQLMLMANASSVLFESLKLMELAEDSDTYKGLSQFIAYVFLLGKLNTADTKEAIKKMLEMISSPKLYQDEIAAMLDQFNDEGKASLLQYLDLILNNLTERILLEDFLDAANRLLDSVTSRYGAWEAAEAHRAAPSTPTDNNTPSPTEGTTTPQPSDIPVPGDYATAQEERWRRVKKRCTGPAATKYPTIAAILADSNPNMDAAAIEKRLTQMEALLLKSSTVLGIGLKGVDDIARAVEETCFERGYDLGIGLPGSGHVDDWNLLDSAFVNNRLVGFLNQLASKGNKQTVLDKLKSMNAPLTSEVGIINAAVISYMETGLPTVSTTQPTAATDDTNVIEGENDNKDNIEDEEANKVLSKFQSLDPTVQLILNTYFLMEGTDLSSLDELSLTLLDATIANIIQSLDKGLSTDDLGHPTLVSAVIAHRIPAATEEVKDPTPNMQVMYGSQGTMLGMVMTPYNMEMLNPANPSGHSVLTLLDRANNYNLTEGRDNAIKIQRIIDNHLKKLQYQSDKKTLRPVHFISAKHIPNAVLSSIEYTAEVEKEVPASEAWIVLGLDGKNYMIIGVTGFTPSLTNTKETWQKLKEDIAAEYVGDETYHVYTKEKGTITNISDGRTIDEYAPSGSSVRLTLAQMLLNDSTNPLHLTPGDLKFLIIYPDGPRGVNIGNEKVYSLRNGNMGTVYMLIPMASGIYYRVPMKPLFLKDLIATTSKLATEYDQILTDITNALDLTKKALWLKSLFHFTDDELFIGELEINGEKQITVTYKARTGAKLRIAIPMGDKQALLQALEQINPPINVSLATLSNTSFVKDMIEIGWSPESIQVLAGVGAGFAVSMGKAKPNPPRKRGQGTGAASKTIITLANSRYKKENGRWVSDTTGDPVTNPKDIENLDLAEAIEAGKYDDQATEWYEEKDGKVISWPGVYYDIDVVTKVEGADDVTSTVTIHRDDKGNYTRLATFMIKMQHPNLKTRPIKSDTNAAVLTLLDKIAKAKDEYWNTLNTADMDIDEIREASVQLLTSLQAERDSLQNLSAADTKAIDDALTDLTDLHNLYIDSIVRNAILGALPQDISIPTGFLHKGQDITYPRSLTKEEKLNLEEYLKTTDLDTMAIDTLEGLLPKIIAGELNNHNLSMSEEDVIEIFSNFAKTLTKSLDGKAYDLLMDKLQDLLEGVDVDDLTLEELSKEVIKFFKNKNLLLALVTLLDTSKDLSDQLKSLLEIIENCR